MSLRLGICLVRLLGLDDCSPPSHCSCMSLRHAWPDLLGCRIVLRLNSVLFRLSGLQGCSPSLQRPGRLGGLYDCSSSLQRPWPTGGTVGLFFVFTASLADWGTVGLFHLFTLPFSDWVDCRIVLVQSIQDLWTRKIYIRNDDFYFICSKN